MKNSVRIFAVVGLTLSLMSTGALASETKGISTGRYITSGILSSALGLGIGHAVQGRYIPLGLVFTIAGATSLTALIADSHVNPVTNRRELGTVGWIALGVRAGFFVWEVIDSWVVGARLHQEYQQQKAALMPRSPKLAVIPVAAAGLEGVPGATLMLRF